jgi:uncharacterized membrane protein
MTIEEAEIREEKSYSGRYAAQLARLKSLLRTLAILLPIALFGAAILVGLVFWVTLMPILGTISVVLTIAATILSLIAAFIFFKP